MAYSKEELQEAVKESICVSDCLKKLNLSVCTFNYKRFWKLCKEYKISTEHFDVQKAVRRNKFEYSYDNVFCENSNIPRFRLRDQIFKFKIFDEYKCDCCDLTSWNDKEITLEVDHINGINNDNRVENLRWLCPNCHSQTPTFRNSNNRK